MKIPFRKISLEDMELLRKYRVQTRNWYVCSQVEEFTCGSHAVIIKNLGMNDETFGISKKEHRISSRQLISVYLGDVNGSSS